MVQKAQIEAAIKHLIPEAQVQVDDLTGGGDHMQVSVVSSAFKGLSKIKQHQLVYEALKNELESEAIHALAINTATN